MDEKNAQIALLSAWLKQSKYCVALTGAGMDTESNTPDFRGKEGWWRKYDPRALASIDTFYDNYQLFREFYTMRLQMLKGVLPHKGHYILAEWEQCGILRSIATQNVAGLHAAAGSKTVYELHGNIRSVRCNDCGSKGGTAAFVRGERCGVCRNGHLRPEVVLFGETLPAAALEASYAEVKKSDLLLVIGTSLEVYPVNQLPRYAGGKVVLINNENVGLDYNFDLRILGSIQEVLTGVDV